MSIRCCFFPVALTLLAGSAAAFGQVAPETVSPPERDAVRGIDRFFRDGFPFFDVRLQTDSELPTPTTIAASQTWLKSDEAARQSEAFASLRAAVPTVKMDLHSVFQTPDFVRSTEAFLTAAAVGQDPQTVVRDFLASYTGLFGINDAELDLARVSRDYLTRHNGVRHLSWQQQIGGVELFGATLNANVMPDGRLINIGGTMIPRPEAGFAVKARVLNETDAIMRAAANVAVRVKGTPARISNEQARDGRTFWTVDGMRKDSAVVTRP
ncbi:MAG: hypothetical protein ACOYN0_14920, partial [Phycisphaerales bacterium]